jgi:predicted metal-dependent HD superfamily phosphohydrolase
MAATVSFTSRQEISPDVQCLAGRVLTCGVQPVQEIAVSMLDEVRWRRLWDRLGRCADVSVVFAKLLEAYSQPHRAYHNAGHIADCLRQFDLARAQAERPDEVEAALWFHDAVYDPRAADNEERSAAWAARALQDAGASPDAGRHVAALILATKHDREPDSHDCGLLVDVDLSILGREPEVFGAYDLAIREEYSWVPEEQYRAGRAAILEGFLRRRSIYHTDFFRVRLEAQARRNLGRLVATLRGQGRAGPGAAADRAHD